MAEDPVKKLTTWLTEGFGKGDTNKEHLDRTRLVVRGQKTWYMASLSLNDPFFDKLVEIDQQLMMAYKGKRSDDVVKALAGIEEANSADVGLREVSDLLKSRRKE